MSNVSPWIIFSVLSLVGVGSVVGQSCETCLDSVPSQLMVAGLSDCPAGRGCHHPTAGLGGKLNFRARVHHLKEFNHLVSQRNVAWPKPFTCADRQLYFKMWEPMLDTGWRASCILNHRHFVEGTVDLNQAGRMKLAAIMKNHAVGQKAFYIARDQPIELSIKRLESVKRTLQQWYGLGDVFEIAFTDLEPVKGDGLRTQNVGQLYSDQTPPPVIPVATGTGFSGGG